MSGVSIKNLTRRKGVPRFAYTAIVKSALPDWDISLVFVGPVRARALNEQMRGKTYIPNVLSYALGTKSGEIIICLNEADKQATSHGMGRGTFVLYLFIHGVLHIKGWAHGARMEACERNLLARFASRIGTPDGVPRIGTPDGVQGNNVRDYPHATTHSNRNRHRHIPSKNGRRRGTH